MATGSAKVVDSSDNSLDRQRKDTAEQTVRDAQNSGLSKKEVLQARDEALAKFDSGLATAVATGSGYRGRNADQVMQEVNGPSVQASRYNEKGIYVGIPVEEVRALNLRDNLKKGNLLENARKTALRDYAMAIRQEGDSLRDLFKQLPSNTQTTLERMYQKTPKTGPNAQRIERFSDLSKSKKDFEENTAAAWHGESTDLSDKINETDVYNIYGINVTGVLDAVAENVTSPNTEKIKATVSEYSDEKTADWVDKNIVTPYANLVDTEGIVKRSGGISEILRTGDLAESELSFSEALWSGRLKDYNLWDSPTSNFLEGIFVGAVPQTIAGYAAAGSHILKTSGAIINDIKESGGKNATSLAAASLGMLIGGTAQGINTSPTEFVGGFLAPGPGKIVGKIAKSKAIGIVDTAGTKFTPLDTVAPQRIADLGSDLYRRDYHGPKYHTEKGITVSEAVSRFDKTAGLYPNPSVVPDNVVAGIHSSPGSLGSEFIVKKGTSSEPGLFVADLASTYFLKVPEINVKGIGFSNPISDIAKGASEVIEVVRGKVDKPSINFIESKGIRQLPEKAAVSKRSAYKYLMKEADTDYFTTTFKMKANLEKGKFAEIEAVAKPGTEYSLKDKSAHTAVKQPINILGLKFDSEVRVPIKYYELKTLSGVSTKKTAGSSKGLRKIGRKQGPNNPATILGDERTLGKELGKTVRELTGSGNKKRSRSNTGNGSPIVDLTYLPKSRGKGSTDGSNSYSHIPSIISTDTYYPPEKESAGSLLGPYYSGKSTGSKSPANVAASPKVSKEKKRREPQKKDSTPQKRKRTEKKPDIAKELRINELGDIII